jgi:hypothetical protein
MNGTAVLRIIDTCFQRVKGDIFEDIRAYSTISYPMKYIRRWDKLGVVV